MKTYIKRYAKNFDFPLFITYAFLCLFGLVMIYSASMVWAVNRYGFDHDHFYRGQLRNLFVAIPVFLIGSFFPYKHYSKKWLMGLMLFVMFTLLILVHIIGDGGDSGSQSWINFGFANLQPSEVAKIIMVLYFAGVFSKKYERGLIDNINYSVGPPLVVLILVLFSIMMETDIGTSIIIFFTAVSVMAASGIKFRTFAKMSGILIGIMVVVAPILYLFRDTILTERRLGRLQAFLNPFEHAQDLGFQVVNGYIAIGSGGLSGLGLGKSIQKMGYLPEPQTDFIMAIIAEELGILGVIIVIGGLGFIVLRALYIALIAKDPLARMIAAGFGSMIGFQTFINLGGLTGIIPLTGVPLPFISYGGTSVILLSLAMGILMNVSMFVKYDSNRE